MSTNNTNMASEFWFFAQLHRLGYKAYITLGNTKAIDMLVELEVERLTFDVKGRESFQSGGYPYLEAGYFPKNHFFVFIGLEVKKDGKKVSFSQNEPECYIVEADKLNTIATPWEAANKKTHGYGFNPKLLSYLKSGGESKFSPKALKEFMQKRRLTSIDFEMYKKSIMTISDFEDRFYTKK